ncbi:MAG: hypothetical protein IT373_25235 [Polyangiaceae bacterium]|nr:hypothetical protein [Polyangiaceae bacterium]
MVAAHRYWFAFVLLFAAGCSRESLLRSALADPVERKETMELTLAICDEHVEYVDDLFVLARGHEPTFDRLVKQAAVALEDPAFAAEIAAKLAPSTRAVETITRATLARARHDPELRRALAAATLAEGDVIQQIAAEHPELVQQVFMRILSGAPTP